MHGLKYGWCAQILTGRPVISYVYVWEITDRLFMHLAWSLLSCKHNAGVRIGDERAGMLM